ncbi:hypothetical protein ACPOL_3919 [Acidisarcina polymorpha]|uniref:Uncharacterized protein n=1 Tax=Acidisarcina polymorpha TaxID=2211140 RepID=A0A2Z5G287_9BACT|nr:hypothetical protein ACPOL_3919 [Acidisarcina polymorpha]
MSVTQKKGLTAASPLTSPLKATLKINAEMHHEQAQIPMRPSILIADCTQAIT